jgi:hypothetical protein
VAILVESTSSTENAPCPACGRSACVDWLCVTVDQETDYRRRDVQLAKLIANAEASRARWLARNTRLLEHLGRHAADA